MKKALNYIIPCLLCTAVVIVILVGRGAFVKSGQELMRDLSDAFSVPGIVTLCFGLLVISTNGGTFDMLSFGVRKLFDLFKKDLTKVKYRTFYDYRKAQQEKKRSFWHFIIIGAAFTAVGIAFVLIYEFYPWAQ